MARRGHFVKDSGATKQKKCEAGAYTDSEGSSSCVSANSGFFVDREGADDQTQCPAGKFSRESGAIVQIGNLA